MKKVMSLILGVAVFAAFSVLFAAEPEAKSTESKSAQTMEKASPSVITGKITHIDKVGQTFLIVSNGKKYRFSYEKIEWNYRVGQIVDVNYVVSPGGQMQATNLNLSKASHY